ncbi:cyclic pyranopterin monophosphate synthase accessory protein [Polymorphobacter glacialis]|uniref:Cyclic pyranopterin monophosphate synthase n=1 Tax=Sandarakinorhabdus glacialis TaxID=1614636 RepID=A0A916ZQ94_9SPHN|nr:cyclic pyranopterin monophosphate synthase MoaC [Polymorphobacter glacialis]GGE07724.1 cyclic pyranopterin monophosphate synthase accessory protein [Polymorphobacter glacialis]
MSLTHLDQAGAARMVDISAKAATRREAVAEGYIAIGSAALTAIREQAVAKGDVLAVARIAGIMAAKRTADLIPLCHPLPIDAVTVDLVIEDAGVRVTAMVATTHGTGVEMEALTAVTTALLTIYDMAKAMDRGMVISGVRLLRKSGGRSGEWVAG